MLRWMSGKVKKDKMRNEYFRDSIRVASIVDKMRGNDNMKKRKKARTCFKKKKISILK